MHPAMFSAAQWDVVMFWYTVLAGVSGGLIMLSVVRTGYNYSRSALNPGIRVSFIEDIQRIVLAVGLIALAPTLITLLIGLNDSLVWLCAKGLVHFVDTPEVGITYKLAGETMFEMVVGGLFKTVNAIINFLFGLKGLDELVFNGNSGNVFGAFFKPLDTGNGFANGIMDLVLGVFDIYFNAVYTIRTWMITACIAVAPIVVWLWALSGEAAILEVFLAELIQSIFMQLSHALSLGIFMSIAMGKGSAAGKAAALGIGASAVSVQLVTVGVVIAGFAGAVCTAVMVVMGIRLMTSTSEKDREDAKSGVRKALIGLLITGLSLVVASFMATTLSGGWGVG